MSPTRIFFHSFYDSHRTSGGHTRCFTTRLCRVRHPLSQIEKRGTRAHRILDTGKANRGNERRRRRRLVTVLLHLVVR